MQHYLQNKSQNNLHLRKKVLKVALWKQKRMMRNTKVNINEYLFIHIKLSSKANSRAMLNVLTHSHCLKAVNIEGPKPEVLFLI